MRWRVRKRTFAHVAAMRHVDAAEKLGISDGRTVTVIIVRSTGAERAALTAIGPPYLASWGDDVLAVVLDEISDWTEVAELIAESYRMLAPGHSWCEQLTPQQRADRRDQGPHDASVSSNRRCVVSRRASERSITTTERRPYAETSEPGPPGPHTRLIENSLPQQGNLAGFCQWSLLELSHDIDRTDPSGRARLPE